MTKLDVPVTIDFDSLEPMLDGLTDEMLCDKIRSAATAAAVVRGFTTGTIGVLVTDDEAIHVINREYLKHDFPTDVISFGYVQEFPKVEGEMVVSLDTAFRQANLLGWTTLNELLLYVVHGTLHVCGMDDGDESACREMRRCESDALATIGISDAARFSPDSATPVAKELDTSAQPTMNRS